MSHLALRRDPKLLQADVKSLLMALVWCAYRDLELGVEDGVWLIPYKGKVTPVPAYKGLIKRPLRPDQFWTLSLIQFIRETAWRSATAWMRT